MSRPPPLPLLGLCSDLFRESVATPGAPDKILARAFRGDRRLRPIDRGFVADTVQGMLRARGLLDATLRRLPRPRPEDAVTAFLRARREAAVRDAALDRAIAAAERETGGVDGWFPEWMRLALPPEVLRAFAEEPPTTLRANTLKLSREDLLDALADEGLDAQPTRWSPWGVTLAQRANVFRTAAFREGLFEMQDEASQLVALLCGARPGSVAVDACAGAGGKTLALAAAMENRGTIYAFDTAAFRLEALRKRAARAGAHNVRARALGPSETRPLARLESRADLVLVDAPCSGTGVLRRNPDIAWKLDQPAVARLVAEQSRLLRAYAPLVKPGGRLVYAVCSLLPAEGAEQIDAFLREAPDFRRAAITLPRELARRGDFAVDPLHHDMDGFFASVLQRR